MPTDNYTEEAIDRILDKLQDETLAVALSGKESNGYMYLVGEARTALQELIRGERIAELTDLDNAYDEITPERFHQYYTDQIKSLSSGQTGKES